MGGGGMCTFSPQLRHCTHYIPELRARFPAQLAELPSLIKNSLVSRLFIHPPLYIHTMNKCLADHCQTLHSHLIFCFTAARCIIRIKQISGMMIVTVFTNKSLVLQDTPCRDTVFLGWIVKVSVQESK